MFYLDGNVNNELTHIEHIYISPLIMATSTTIRTICVIAMLVLGKKTIQCRNQNEARIRNITNLHGTEAEELNLLKILRRGVRDVFKVNIWTCVFLLPMTFVSIMILLGLGPIFGSLIFEINAVCVTSYTVATPIIYLSCFSKIREFWAQSIRDFLSRISRQIWPRLLMQFLIRLCRMIIDLFIPSSKASILGTQRRKNRA